MSSLLLPNSPGRFRLLYLTSVLVSVFMLLAGTTQTLAEKTGWFSDIPVIDGMNVNAELSFAFDSPSGRILILFLETETADDTIASAYKRTLTAFGWVEQAGRFMKQDEQLLLEKINVQNKMVWRLTLLPATANQLEIR